MMSEFATTDVLRRLDSSYYGLLWSGLVELERYWRGDHPYHTILSTAEKNDPDILRYWRIINMCKVVIDEPVGYIIKAPITIKSNDEMVSNWATKFYRRRIKRVIGDLVKYQGAYGYGFLRLWTDLEGDNVGLKVLALPPVEGGNKRLEPRFEAEDHEQLTSAIVHYTMTQTMIQNVAPENRKKKRLELTRQTITEYEQAGKSDNFVKVASRPNPWGVLTVATCWNDAPSDIIEMMPMQDDFNKTWLDFRQARDIHGFPIITTDAKDAKGITVGARRVLYGGNFSRIQPGDLGQLLDAENRIIERMAMVSRSLSLLYTSGKGTNLSGEALRNIRTAFESKLDGKAAMLSECVADVLLQASRMLARDPELYALEKPSDADGKEVTPKQLEAAEFEVILTPQIPADENADRASIATAKTSGVYSQREALLKLGHTPDEADKIVAETRDEMSVTTPRSE